VLDKSATCWINPLRAG